MTINPFSMFAQVSALSTPARTVSSQSTRAPAVKTPTEMRKDSDRIARADALRNKALVMMFERGPVFIGDLHKDSPGTSRHQWPWIMTTLIDRQLAIRVGQQKGHQSRGRNGDRFDLTDEGRKVAEKLSGKAKRLSRTQ